MKKILTVAAALALLPAAALAQQNTAIVEQSGDRHFANLQQAAGSSATIKQVGAGNIISSLPWEDPSEGAFTQVGSSLTAEQYGNNNVIVGGQINSSASILQNEATDHGDGNAVELTQSDGAFATIEQEHYDDGSGYYEGNVARLTQAGASTAFIRQDGGGNDAMVTQTGELNEVSLTQQGRAHEATISQVGAGNRVQATSHDWYGTLAITQDGSGHGVYFRQSGGKTTERSATIEQLDTGNTVGAAGDVFSQRGDSWLSVTQDGTANTVIGSQDGGIATVTQTGDYNTATVTQSN